MSNDSTEIIHVATATGGEFLIGRDAIMTYRNLGENGINVNHTKVAKHAEGQGLAGRLYHHMIEFARSHQLKVTPGCSYVKAKFDRHPEHADVLAQQ